MKERGKTKEDMSYEGRNTKAMRTGDLREELWDDGKQCKMFINHVTIQFKTEIKYFIHNDVFFNGKLATEY